MINDNSGNRKKYLIAILLIVIFGLILLLNYKTEIFTKKDNFDVPESESGKVIFKILPEYDKYYIDQLIWIKAVVINNSKENYFIVHPLKRSFVRIEETFPSGNRISGINIADTTKQSDSLMLKPGSSFEKVILLNSESEEFYGDMKRETGIYKLFARYQDLVSDEITINVSEPEGKDKELYDRTFLQLFKSEKSDYEKVSSLGELLKRYPGTKYSPQLYKIFLTESKYSKDYNNNSDEINYFFENNHDTYGADLILDIGNVNFEKLLSRYRDSKTGYMIRQRRKETLTHK